MAKDSIRRSQMITTFGPGAMIDLPKNSVIVGGLEGWHFDRKKQEDPIVEPRLLANAKALVPSVERFRMPPAMEERGFGFSPNVTAWRFPEWFVSQGVDREHGGFRRRRLVPASLVERGKFEGRPVVPIRFVRACTAGHVDDIDWNHFVHGGASTCAAPKWIEERGTTGRLGDTFVVCGCGKRRSMSQAKRAAKKDDPPPLRFCTGRRPWLGAASGESCTLPSRLLIRSASNAYFPFTLSAISIPGEAGELADLVELWWEQGLKLSEQLPVEAVFQSIVAMRDAFIGFDVADIREAIENREAEVAVGGLRADEFSVLTRDREEVGKDEHGSPFYATRFPESEWKTDWPWMAGIADVRLVHRLREVVTLAGFTRFEAPVRDVDGSALELDVALAPLSRSENWLPATENFGEGVFLRFDDDALAAWLDRPVVKERAQLLADGFGAKFDTEKRPFFGPTFYMVHSFSHLLMTQISLACGYPASSLRERLYVEGGQYGLMIFTGSSDAEGTLGGLVEAGKRLPDLVRRALLRAEFCSSDPVCASEVPEPEVQRALRGSACHGCLLVAETSCERQNEFLDRALVVRTLGEADSAFFRGYR